jgi:hypothetical protein
MPKLTKFKFQKLKIKRFTSFVNIYSACLIDTGIVISDDELKEQVNNNFEKNKKIFFLLLFCLNF